MKIHLIAIALLSAIFIDCWIKIVISMATVTVDSNSLVAKLFHGDKILHLTAHICIGVVAFIGLLGILSKR